MKILLTATLVCVVASLALRAQPEPAASEPRAFARVVPERKDDLAWENDLTAFRIYGPALKNSPELENSGIDVWFKRVPYPIIDKWYREDLAGIHNYHQENHEGYDGFKVADSRGVGGTALWRDGRLVLGGVYQSARVVVPGPKEVKFVANYRYETSDGLINEEKTISMKLGRQLFESRSVFTREGEPVAGLPVAIGLVTQTPKAEITCDPKAGCMAIWDVVNDAGFGIGAAVPPARVVEMLRQPTSDRREHALCIVRTDADGAVEFQAGYAWAKAGAITSPDQWLAYLKRAVTASR